MRQITIINYEMNVKKVVPITLDSLLSTLKPRQIEAIKHTQAPQLILAGAGTGKTTTITAKIAYMVEKENIAPSHILALTFSKEAAKHMREKVEKFLQEKISTLKRFTHRESQRPENRFINKYCRIHHIYLNPDEFSTPESYKYHPEYRGTP